MVIYGTCMMSGEQIPSCLVCKAPSSGIHFGVITCDACKTFFQRSLSRKMPYACRKNFRLCCPKLPTFRFCSSCRYKKCLEVGMSKEGIVKGRYSMETRMSIVKATDEDQHRETLEKSKQKCLEELIEVVTSHDRKYPLYSKELLQQIPEMERQYVEWGSAREKLFGPLRPMKPEVYTDLYHRTGLDLDDFLKRFKYCVEHFEPDAVAYLNYIQNFPGIEKFSVNDKLILLKASVAGWLLLSALEAYNIELMLYTCSSCGLIFSQDDFEKYACKDYYRCVFHALALLKKVNITSEEMALVKAFVLFDPHGVYNMLEDRAGMERYQEDILEALAHLVQRTRGHVSAKIIGYISHALVALREALGGFMDVRAIWYSMFAQTVTYPPIILSLYSDFSEDQSLLIRALTDKPTSGSEGTQ